MSKTINWFPGHMAKANRNILESIKKVDLVLEVVDARAINTTSNKEFIKLNKPVLKVALKSDIADIKNIKWQPNLIVGSTKNKSFKTTLLNEIKKILAPLEAKKKAKGIIKPTFYLMVVGLPNVGKSSLINFLANKNIAPTGNRPAVTKKQSILKISEDLYLQDNPGVFFKNVEDVKEGYVLALLNTVKKEVLPLDEVLQYCYNYLSNHYYKQLAAYYHLEYALAYNDFVKWYANKRHFITANNQSDIVRTQDALFDDFVNGKICKVNYEN
ncbi:MAG: ribosome biogenesis GTPase YlqF [Mycoplasmoidaceae bacterium]|nr:ribosome biogenesis GTPase YlqF [Mycoplasmoidaceae bacterium]